MRLIPSDKILLTGAGFTKNFGGFLSEEMSDQIFNSNEVEEEGRVKEFIRNNPDLDYEILYQKIQKGKEFKKNEKQAFHNAVLRAYQNLDEAIRQWIFNFDSPYPVCAQFLNEMISRFADSGQGYFFTLNQDLFIERKYKGRNSCWPAMGTVWDPPFHKNNISFPLKEEDFCTLPNNDILDENKKEQILKSCRFMYIKLHGSYGWLSHDGSQKMVIGGEKLEKIKKEPLLRWYYDLFNKVFANKNQKLMVIGYGFRDEHINEILSKSPGLKICVISPLKRKDFKEMLIKECPFGEKLHDLLYKYYDKNLEQIFPMNQEVSLTYKQIKRDFFGLLV